jgi:hypothetical protein
MIVLSCLKFLSFMRKFRKNTDTDRDVAIYHDKYLLATIFSAIPVNLSKILSIFGSDKNLPGQHTYGDTYQELFKKIRYKRIKILEIGLFYGNSLLTWRWFFPFATIIGIDILPRFNISGKRVKIYKGDQYSKEFLKEVGKSEVNFDIIIDDGSHMSAHQIFSFENLFEFLNDGGLYIIEDVQTSFWSRNVIGEAWDGRHFNDIQFSTTCFGYFLELSKYINHAEFQTLEGVDSKLLFFGKNVKRIAFEHNIIIIWKGKNDEKSNSIRRE